MLKNERNPTWWTRKMICSANQIRSSFKLYIKPCITLAWNYHVKQDFTNHISKQTSIDKILFKGTIQSKKTKKCMEISIPVGGEGVRPRSISIQFLKCVEWSNSSRNAKKIFSIFSGGSTLIWAKLMKIF